MDNSLHCPTEWTSVKNYRVLKWSYKSLLLKSHTGASNGGRPPSWSVEACKGSSTQAGPHPPQPGDSGAVDSDAASSLG